MTITEFLEARIAEDEQRHVMLQPHDELRDAWGVEWFACACGLNVAECAAKRAIVGIHSQTEGLGYQDTDGLGYGRMDSVCTTCGTSDEYGTEWPCNTILALAAIYAAHPDYESVWAPDRPKATEDR